MLLKKLHLNLVIFILLISLLGGFVNALNFVPYGNISMRNNSIINGTNALFFGNVTAGNFLGIYNWSVNADNTSEFISFDGSVFSYTQNNLDLLRFFDGMIIETINVSICADSGCTVDDNNVKLIVQANPVGDLTVDFSSGFLTVDTTPPVEVNLTAGSNTSPQMNFVYILESTGLLTVSTVSFPSLTVEFAPIAEVLVPSVARVIEANVYKLHAWTDHSYTTDDNGHLSHINSWIRQQPATWMSGVTATLTRNATPTPDSLLFSSTSGSILQLHTHTFSAISDGTEIHVVNDNSEAYKKITDLNEINTDSDGDSMSNKHYKLVVWGAVGENTEDNEIFLNLPSCSYSKASLAFADNDRCANFNIPSDFVGVGFLIAAYTIRNSGGGNTFTISNTEDLRGLFPSTDAGGANAFVSEFADNAFKVFDESDATKILMFNLDDLITGTTAIWRVYEGGSLNLSSGNLTVNNIDAITINVSSDFEAGGTLFINSTNKLVGIGTSAPGLKLEVKDTSANTVLRIQDSSNTCSFGVDGSGWASISCSSDEKLKRDITIVPKNTLKNIADWIYNYPLKEFTMKSNGERQIGVIAQDIQLLNPSKVSTIKEFNTYTNQIESYLTVQVPATIDLIIALQLLKEEVELIKLETCNKDDSYKWCGSDLYHCEARPILGEYTCEGFSRYYSLSNGKCLNSVDGNKLCKSGWLEV